MAGFGYTVSAVDKNVGDMARLACAFKAEAADLRAWFDRISTDADDSVAAAALKAAIEGDGGTITDAKALKTIQAMREFTYWAATFAPTHTLDVRGPSALL